MCFVWISEQPPIISLYGINPFVFITGMERVYCAVRTESLNVIYVNLILQGLKNWAIRLRSSKNRKNALKHPNQRAH